MHSLRGRLFPELDPTDVVSVAVAGDDVGDIAVGHDFTELFELVGRLDADTGIEQDMTFRRGDHVRVANAPGLEDEVIELLHGDGHIV